MFCDAIILWFREDKIVIITDWSSLHADGGYNINAYDAELFLYKPWGLRGYLQFENIMNVLVSSFCFIWRYLCYESTAISNIEILTMRGSTLNVRIWRLQMRVSCI